MADMRSSAGEALLRLHRDHALNEDRDKWDQRYSQGEPEPSDPDPLLYSYRHLLTGGRALDIAAGLGGNALFVAEQGYAVDAVDISPVALQRLNQAARVGDLPVNCIEADLDTYPIPEETYDLVLIFQFFAPSLMGSIERCLKHGGLLFHSTFNYRHQSLKPEFCPDYLVPRDGLSPFFTELETILDEPEGGPDGNLARLIARRR